MMRTLILAAAMIAGMAASTLAMADEFAGTHEQNGPVGAYLDQQSTNAQDSDTTARDSVRSHGHP